jgi:hypothetical protein
MPLSTLPKTWCLPFKCDCGPNLHSGVSTCSSRPPGALELRRAECVRDEELRAVRVPPRVSHAQQARLAKLVLHAAPYGQPTDRTDTEVRTDRSSSMNVLP